MQRLRVFVTDWDYPSLDLEQQVMDQAGLDLVPVQCRTEDDLVRLCSEADGLLNQYAPMTARVLSQLKRCRVLVRYGVGIDNVDLAAATKLRIAVCNVPDYGVEEVSDHALALLYSLARGVTRLDREIRTGTWDFSLSRPLARMRGKVLGIVGMGRIGTAVARKAANLGLRVLGCDASPLGSQTLATPVSFETLLRESDYISVHVPLTPATRHMFNQDTFRQMKPAALFVNTARGGVVDTESLVRALQERWIAGAALDVLEKEPIPRDHPLLSIHNCILTPHSAWYSEDAFVDLKTKAAEEAARLLTGRTPLYCLNPQVLDVRHHA